MSAADRARARAGTATRPTYAQNLDHYRRLGRDAADLKTRIETRARLTEAAAARTRGRTR